MNSFPSPLSLLVFLVVWVGGFNGGDRTELFSQQSPRTLEVLYGQWQDVDTKLKGLEAEMANGAVDEEINKNYRDALGEATRLIDVLESAEPLDSKLEEEFATKWGEGPRDGWQLIREGEVLFENQKVFVPDFLFVHSPGRRVLLEVVGFWTPEYLDAKLKTLATFSEHRIFLAIADSIDWDVEQIQQSCNSIIRYKTTIKIKDVLEQLGNFE